MIPDLWKLQHDPLPLTTAALAWQSVAEKAAATADRIVEAARRVVGEGWESEAAERFTRQHHVVVEGLDSMSRVAYDISDTLSGICAELDATQRRLDVQWAPLAQVRHEYVGAERVLLLWPEAGVERHRVELAVETATLIRTELDDKLYDDAGTLSAARSSFEDTHRNFIGIGDVGLDDGTSTPETGTEDPGREKKDKGVVVGTPESPHGLPGIGPVTFDAPSMNGLSGVMAGGLMSAGALAKAVAKSRENGTQQIMPASGSTVGRGGMAGGGARGGGGRGARGGPRVLRPTAKAAEPSKAEVQDKARRDKLKEKIREKATLAQSGEAQAAAEQEERDAKRALIEERRAARAARRAAREGAAAEA